MREEHKSEFIHDALNVLDDEMIEDVAKMRESNSKDKFEHRSIDENIVVSDDMKNNKKKTWHKWTAMAASVCVLFLCGWMVSNGFFLSIVSNEKDKTGQNDTNLVIEEQEHGIDETLRGELDDKDTDGVKDLSDSLSEEESVQGTPESLKTGVVIPQMEVNLRKSEESIEADMLGFFILGGRSYIQYEFQHNYVESGADFVGDYVGHIEGMIDEWTKEDGYVDGAGTYTGDVYEVKGVSPEFMLCMVWEDGSVETFINHNDITLYKGSDLVDDWLDLRGNYDAVAFEIIQNQQWTYDALELTEEEMLTMERFLDAFAEGDFVYVATKLEYPFGGDFDTEDMMDFYYIKENGVRLRFRTLGDGYVSFPWLNACIQIDQELYNDVVDVLTMHK